MGADCDRACCAVLSRGEENDAGPNERALFTLQVCLRLPWPARGFVLYLNEESRPESGPRYTGTCIEREPLGRSGLKTAAA